MVSTLVPSLWSAHWSRLYGHHLGLLVWVLSPVHTVTSVGAVTSSHSY
jgi:hypothetical protein